MHLNRAFGPSAYPSRNPRAGFFGAFLMMKKFKGKANLLVFWSGFDHQVARTATKHVIAQG